MAIDRLKKGERRVRRMSAIQRRTRKADPDRARSLWTLAAAGIGIPRWRRADSESHPVSMAKAMNRTAAVPIRRCPRSGIRFLRTGRISIPAKSRARERVKWTRKGWIGTGGFPLLGDGHPVSLGRWLFRVGSLVFFDLWPTYSVK